MKHEIFSCDECKKESEGITATKEKYQTTFPYGNGWVYLFSLDFKVEDGKQHPALKDKHFCNVDCFTKYVKRTLESAQLAAGNQK